MSDSGPADLRQTLYGTLVAGVVAVVVFYLLATAGVGSGLVQSVVAVGLGILAAQLYEYYQ